MDLYHKETEEVCKRIGKQLELYGIQTDMATGQILYSHSKGATLACNKLYLVRHAETFGTKEKKFMSDFSTNSVLTEYGKDELKCTADIIDEIKFDCVLYSDIPRVKLTADIIKERMVSSSDFIELHWMRGINNDGWQEKSKDDLYDMDAEDFYQREVLHNIFAKSSRGSSWGEVLCMCIQLIKYINYNYANKNVLLISQGSVKLGIEILMHMVKKPWEKYSTDEFFSLNGVGQKNYGKIQCIYDADKNKM